MPAYEPVTDTCHSEVSKGTDHIQAKIYRCKCPFDTCHPNETKTLQFFLKLEYFCKFQSCVKRICIIVIIINITYQNFDVLSEKCNGDGRCGDKNAENNSAQSRIHRTLANFDQIHHVVAQCDHNQREICGQCEHGEQA